jgi:Flp pilus assembly protein TadG
MDVLRNRRGATMVAMAVALTAFLALTVVGVDVARLAFTANEVQTVADVAATAGARALLDGRPMVADAQAAVAQNRVDGGPAAIDPPGTIEQGSIDLATASFVPGGVPATAVRANAEATVQNLVASLLGNAHTVVRKTATAAFVTTGSGDPTLPLALGECHFPETCVSGSCLPHLVTAPSATDNSGWTGLLQGASQQQILSYFPAPCGGGAAEPTIHVGDNISLSNGEVTPLFNAVRCMVCTLNINEFLVPVVQECQNNFNQTSPVVGFATITVDHFTFSDGSQRLCQPGGGAVNGIVINALFRTDVPGSPGGCPGCGSGYITLVE